MLIFGDVEMNTQ